MKKTQKIQKTTSPKRQKQLNPLSLSVVDRPHPSSLTAPRNAPDRSKIQFEALDRFYRAPIEDVKVIDDEKQILRLSISSEFPVERYDCISETRFYEVLSHNPDDIDLSRFQNSASWRDEHYGDQIGVISNPAVQDKKLYIDVEFSRANPRAILVYKDIKNKIRCNVSVRPEYTGPPTIEPEKHNGLRVLRFPWRPVHGATVADPADPTVGAGRNQQSRNVTFECNFNANPEKEHKTMNPELRALLETFGLDRSATETQAYEYLNKPEIQAKLAANAQAANRNHTPQQHPPTAGSVTINENTVRSNELTRITEIQALGREFKMEEAASRAVADNITVDAFRKVVCDELAQNRQLTPVKKQDPQLGMNQRDLSQYSINRALSRLLMDKPVDGLERECSDEVAKLTNRSAQGFFIPPDVMFAAPNRGQTVGSPAAGGNLVDTKLMLGSMVQELYNAMVLSKMGVQTLPGLVGDVAIPTDEGGICGYWLDENGTPNESEFGVGQVGLTPHTVGAIVNLSRRLILQTGNWVEGFVRRKIMRTLGLMIQQAAIKGTGAKGEPLGLLSMIPAANIVAIGANGGVPTYKKIVELETKIADENADFGTLAYLTNSAMRGQLKVTEEFAGTSGRPVWRNAKGGVGEMNGYDAYRTNQVPRDLKKGESTDCSAIIFGNFAAMVIGLWSGVDITVDRATEAKSGGVNVIALQDCDIKLERKVSFSAIKDAKVG